MATKLVPMKKTIIVNLFAGPGAGKSTLAAGIFAELKWADIDTELVREFAKDIVWEGSEHLLMGNHEPFIFGTQLKRITDLIGKVDVVVTDAPIMNSLLYYDGPYKDTMANLVVHIVRDMNNMNFFIERKKKYKELGRTQSENQARSLDLKIRHLLDKHCMPFTIKDGVKETAKDISDLIIAQLQKE